MRPLGKITKLVKCAGVAGQISIDVTVEMQSGTYNHGFVGSVYGSPGPIIFLMGSAQTIVDAPERFGERFDKDWVRRFYRDPAA